MLSVMLICGIVSLVNSIPFSIKTIYSHSKVYLGVTGRGDPKQVPELKKMIIEETPYTLEAISEIRGTDIVVKSIVGEWPFVILGLKPDDMKLLMSRSSVTRVDGRYPKPNEAAVIISEPVARNLDLKIGSVLLKPSDQDFYSPYEVKVVGIAQSTEWFAYIPYEYLAKNHFPPIDALIVLTKNPADQPKLDAWVTKRVEGLNARTFSYAEIEESANTMFSILYKILNVIIATLVLVITLMMSLLMNIYLSQRIQEFGLLQALGYTRGSILKRVFTETGILVLFGWVAGLGLAYLLLNLVRAQLLYPQAFAMAQFDRTAYLSTIPVPVAIFAMSILTILAKFRRFDPVSIVERRLI